MKYKGYTAVITYDEEQRLLHGRVIGINDVINFYGRTPDELETAFKDSVEDYLDFCESEGAEPEKPYSGEFPFRTTPQNHRLIAEAAYKTGFKSINKWVECVLLEQAKKLSDKDRVLD